jgi:hypothetical protein
LFRRCLSVIFLVFASVLISSLLAIAQAAGNSASTSNSSKSVDISGKWQIAWTGRLGTEHCTLQLAQDSGKLKGTFQDQRGSSPLSGTIDGAKISFDVQFQGAHPFTTRFTGTIDADKITGTSQAVGVGGNGAYLGHAGEIVQPEHPWTAARAVDQANPEAQSEIKTGTTAKSTSDPAAKN